MLRVRAKNAHYWSGLDGPVLDECTDLELHIAMSNEEIDILQAKSAVRVFNLGYPPIFRLPRLHFQTLVSSLATSFLVQAKERIPGTLRRLAQHLLADISVDFLPKTQQPQAISRLRAAVVSLILKVDFENPSEDLAELGRSIDEALSSGAGRSPGEVRCRKKIMEIGEKEIRRGRALIEHGGETLQELLQDEAKYFQPAATCITARYAWEGRGGSLRCVQDPYCSPVFELIHMTLRGIALHSSASVRTASTLSSSRRQLRWRICWIGSIRM